MIIEQIDNEIVIRLPIHIDIKELQRFLDYLTYKEISRKSIATQEDANILAKTVNKSWWEQNKRKYLPEL